MARQLRIEYEGAFYHITYRGNERKRIFFAESDYHKFRQYLVKAQERYGIVLHCYILMTNHYHFLIETPYANLSKAMHFLNSSYTTYAKMKHKRSGHLFQGRYKAILVDKDRYLLELSRYLHLNPVRAGMVNRPEDYSFSSYTCYITGVGGGLVSSDLILRMFNPETPKARISYRDFVEAAMEGRQPNPFDSVYYGMMLGSEQFVRQILNRFTGGRSCANEDISCRRELNAPWMLDDVLERVRDHLNVSEHVLFKGGPNYPRKVAIYLLKKYTSATNRQIAEYFGVLAIQVWQKLIRGSPTSYQRILPCRTLQNRIRKIEQELSPVRG